MAPVLPKGSTILVTGANGYMGSHVVDLLLAGGYDVRATVRSADNGEALKSVMAKRQPGTSLTYQVADNSAPPETWDQLMAGCAGVVHVASDVSMNPDPHAVIPVMVEMLRAVLAAAKRAGSIRRFVYTSSSAAIGMPRHFVEYAIDEGTWNDASSAEAWAAPHRPDKAYTVYAASKAEAERAAWQFMADERPGFVLNTVNPETLFGEILLGPGSTGGLLRAFARDPADEANFMRQVPPQHGVNVRDVAKLHLAALLDPDVAGRRLLAYAWPYNLNVLADVIRALDPARPFPALPEFPKDFKTVHQAQSLELLRRMGQDGFTPMEQTVRETIYS